MTRAADVIADFDGPPPPPPLPREQPLERDEVGRLPRQPKRSRRRPEQFSHPALAYFALIEAREDGDAEGERMAMETLRRFGWFVRWRRPARGHGAV